MLMALVVFLRSLRLICGGHRTVALENLALRQQLATLTRTVNRPQLRTRDRFFWILLSKSLAGVAHRIDPRAARHCGAVAPAMASLALDPALTTSPPGPANDDFGHSRARPDDDHRESVVGRAADPRRMRKVGHRRVGTDRVAAAATTAPFGVPDVADVSHQSCRHARVDGLLHRADLTGRVLFVLVLLSHQRRRVVHVNVTEHPTAVWTAQQMIEAFPEDTAPRWLLHDRDAVYGDVFRRRIASMGIGEVVSSPSSPWQNP
jgi:hypothetical protein